MIIAIANTKGGVGKTVIAANILAFMSHGTGLSLLAVDGDRQGSLKTVLDIRAKNASVPAVSLRHIPDGEAMLDFLQGKEAASYANVVIDVGGYDSPTIRAALLAADVSVSPIRPRGLDLWALGDMADLVAHAQKINRKLKPFVILNAADPANQGRDNQETAQAVAESYAPLKYLDAPICQRKAYANAVNAGLGVNEWKPTDRKAVAEVNALLDAIGAAGGTKL